MAANHAHTPSLEQMRDLYVRHADQLGIASDHVLHAEFDRFLAAAEQRGAKSALLRAEKLLEEDRTELGEEVGVDVILRWLRYLATGSTDRRADLLEGDDD